MSAPVHDIYAERSLINAAIGAGAWDGARHLVRAADFHLPAHRKVWAAVASVGLSGGAMDTAAVSAHLATAGAAQDALDALLAATSELPTARYADAHARRVRNLAAVRAVLSTMGDIAADAHGGIEDVDAWLDAAERSLVSATEGRAETSALRHIRDGVQAAYEGLVARAEAGGGPEGYLSGLIDLDKALSGWAPSRFYIIGGRPGSGKTVLSKDIALGVARSTRKPVLIFSLEVPEEEWVGRAITSEGSCTYDEWRNAKIERGAWAGMTAAAGELSGLPVWIDETAGVTVEYIARAARHAKREHGSIGMIVIDHMMLMGASDRRAPREQQMALITRSLKGLAKDIKTPVVGLAQLNRECEKRPDRRPKMSDIRESGAAEQDADAIIFVYRDEVYNPQTQDKGIMEAIIAKQRAGHTGTTRLGWEGSRMRVRNLSHQGTYDDPTQGRY